MAISQHQFYLDKKQVEVRKMEKSLKAVEMIELWLAGTENSRIKCGKKRGCRCLHIRELKLARFWDADGDRKWAIFTFNLLSHNHIHITKYLLSSRDK